MSSDKSQDIEHADLKKYDCSEEGHSHLTKKQDQCHQKKSKTSFEPILQFSSLFLITNGIIMCFMYFDPLFTEFEQKILYPFHFFLLTMILISYRVMSTTNNKLALDGHYKELQYRFIESKECQKCQWYRVGPFSHCSKCEICIPRMDHHCPWVGNCISWRNHKAFILFILYVVMVSVPMTPVALKYFYNTFWTDNQENPHSPFVTAYLQTTILLQVPLGLMAFTLLIQHSYLICLGTTTLNLMKRQFMTKKERSDNINMFDQGIIGNIFNFFDQRMFLFWFPTRNYSFDDGYGFPMNPALTVGDIKRTMKKQSKIKIDYDIELRTFNSHNMNFQFNGKVYL